VRLHTLSIVNAVWIIALTSFVRAEDLSALSRQWIALRTDQAAEQAAWEEQKQAYQREIALLKTERDRLTEDIASMQESASLDDSIHKEESARSAMLQQTIEEAHPVLLRVESHVRAWTNQIPRRLLTDLDRLFATLPVTERSARQDSVGERLQRVVALLSAVESLQRQIHVTQELVMLSDKERNLADVLYLGTARAYAVGKKDTWAAVGEPGADGWVWSDATPHASAFRQAIRMARREQLAAFVPLPLRVHIVEDTP